MSSKDVPESLVIEDDEVDQEESKLAENEKDSDGSPFGAHGGEDKIGPKDGGYGQELKRLRARHHYMIRLKATGQYSNKEIANIVGVTPGTVSNVLNSELARQKLKYLQEQADAQVIDLFKQLQELAPLAVNQLAEVLQDPGAKYKDKIKAAKEILDRAGHGKTQNVNMRHETVDDNDIKEIKAEAKRRAKADGHLKNAKVLEDSSDSDNPTKEDGGKQPTNDTDHNSS